MPELAHVSEAGPQLDFIVVHVETKLLLLLLLPVGCHRRTPPPLAIVKRHAIAAAGFPELALAVIAVAAKVVVWAVLVAHVRRLRLHVALRLDVPGEAALHPWPAICQRLPASVLDDDEEEEDGEQAMC